MLKQTQNYCLVTEDLSLLGQNVDAFFALRQPN